MRYAVSNWIYGDEPLERTFSRLRRFGYDGIEIKGEPGTVRTPIPSCASGRWPTSCPPFPTPRGR